MAPPRCLFSSELLQATQTWQPQQPHSLHVHECVSQFLATDITDVPARVTSMPQKSKWKNLFVPNVKEKSHTVVHKGAHYISTHGTVFLHFTTKDNTA